MFIRSQYTNVMDRQTDTARQHIASRGKKRSFNVLRVINRDAVDILRHWDQLTTTPINKVESNLT